MSIASASALITANRDAMTSRWRWRSLAVSAGAFACGLALLLVNFAALSSMYHDRIPDRYSGFLFLDILVGFICCAVVGPMHDAGRWNLLLLAAATLSSLAVPAGFIGIIRLAQRRNRADDLAVIAVALLTYPIDIYGDDGFLNLHPDWSDIIGVGMTLLIVSVFILWGRHRADREARLIALEQATNAAYRERDALEQVHTSFVRSRNAEVARARAEERTMLARDMHDSLSHHLSLIAMHAGAMAFRDDLGPEQMRTTARTVRDAAESANNDLRTVLSALRHDVDRDDVTTPLPTFAAVDEVIDASRARGHQIDVHLEEVTRDDLATLPASTVGSLHRIVTELVVNAEKYAPTAPLDLTFAHRGNRLVVRAENATAQVGSDTALGTGLGLVGLGERARLLGGMMTCTNDGTHFTVEVRIPWTR